MKKIKFKTLAKKQISDTITPVGLYLRLRDIYHNTLLLESSDYHSKEESFSFIAIEPIFSMKVDNNQFIISKQGKEVDKQPINNNFFSLFDHFSNSIQLDCPKELKSFNGLYGIAHMIQFNILKL